MTPAEITIFLWHYTSPKKYEGPEHFNFVNGCLRSFVANGLMEEKGIPSVPDGSYEPHCYRVTEKGKAYAEMLCATPFPVAVWIHPYEAEKLRANQ